MRRAAGLSRLIPPGSLLRERSFGLFWGAHAISEAGSRITSVVAPILVYQLTGSALGTGVLAALQAVPYLLFGLLAGAIADRADRRRLMVGCNVLQTVILATVPLAAAAGVLGVEQVFVVAVLSATLFVWFDAANFGALPLIAGRDRLVEANAAVSGASSLIAVVGPAVAGVLAATIGPAYAIGLDAASYGLSAIALLLVRAPFSTRHLDPASVEPVVRRLLADVHEGLRFLWGHRLVRTLTLLGFGVSFTGGAVTGLTVVYGVQALGLPDSGAGIGLLFSAAALGSLVSSVLLPSLNRRYATGSITLGGLTAAVVAVAALALVTNLAAALVFFFAWGAAQTLVIINAISLRQQVAPDHLQSRVNVSARMIAWGGMPFGAAVGGALAEVTSIEATYLVMALGVGISAAIGWFSPLRSANPSAHGRGQANSQT
jgi:MFS family permease